MIENVKANESALIATLKAAAASLDAIGTDEVAAALAVLQKAADDAQERLQKAAEQARSILRSLASKSQATAAQLQTDLFAPAKPAAQQQEQEKKPAADVPDFTSKAAPSDTATNEVIASNHQQDEKQ